MEFYLRSLEEPSPSSIWGRWVARRAKQKEPKNKLTLLLQKDPVGLT